MIIQDLQKRGLIHPPKWLADNCAYVTIMGSQAYAVSDGKSDEDLYGFCFPPLEMVFPHLAGDIPGFGRQKKRFDVWQQHHVKREDNGKEYDMAIFSIARYFDLCMENNPNMIDSLFTPESCVKHITEVGRMVRDRRRIFLHKGSWHSFKGYAYNQLKKMNTKNPTPGSKRYEDIQKHGMDTKYSYHLVRLIGEVEQILTEGDLDLTRNNEQLKSIRRGEWTQEQVVDYFTKKQSELETVYNTSTLQYEPDENLIKQLLLDCLEHHYGTISKSVIRETKVDALIKEMSGVLDKYRLA